MISNTKTDSSDKKKYGSFLKANYHCHTNYCDGSDSARTLVETAIQKGFDILGISSHTMYPFAQDWHICPKQHENYVKEIQGLKTEYQDKIQLLCGFEADYVQGLCSPDFNRFAEFDPDYIIGSVHFIPSKAGLFAIDDSTANVEKGLKEGFNGNGKKMVQEYFYQQRQMLDRCSFTILGHPDLIVKRNGVLKFFDPKDSWYKNELKALAKAIVKNGCLVEVNTGGINRGIMDDVYPCHFLLELLGQKNVPVLISSDAHKAADLDGGFEKARSAIKKAGINTMAVISKNDIPALQGTGRTIITLQDL